MRGPRTFAEILGPLHKEVGESGISDEDFDSLLESALEESRRGRTKKEEYLVSWNERHLNYHMKVDTPEWREFRSRFPNLLIVTPPQFLEAVRIELG